jgi:hypothetical protein
MCGEDITITPISIDKPEKNHPAFNLTVPLQPLKPGQENSVV